MRGKGFPAANTYDGKIRFDALDEKEVVRKRRGAKEASKTFAPRSGRLAVRTPIEIVQTDHTLADIILVDYVDWRPLARSYLTVAIDVARTKLIEFFASLPGRKLMLNGDSFVDYRET